MSFYALKKPLKFGDREQIAALKKVKEGIKKQEEETFKLKPGDIKRYKVLIQMVHNQDFEVWATDEMEAKAVAEALDDLEQREGFMSVINTEEI